MAYRGATLSAIVRGVGVVLFIMMTISFVLRDSVWTGQWRAATVLGQRSAAISAPWPAERWQRTTSGIQLNDESVYLTIRIPRSFIRLRSILVGSIPPDMQIGVETRPNTLSYRLQSCDIITVNRCEAVIPLVGVDQRRRLLNLVLRWPQARSATATPNLERIELNFERPHRTFKAVLPRLWQFLGDSRSS